MERRKMAAPTEAEMHAAKIQSKLFRDMPQIIAHCTCVRFSDGSPRKPGWVVLRTFRGAWEAVAKEPDSALSLTVCDPNLDDCLVLLDTLLGDPAAPWQYDSYLGNGHKPKKPK